MERIPKMIINLYRNEEYYSGLRAEAESQNHTFGGAVNREQPSRAKDEGRLNCKQKNSKQGENLITDSQAKFISVQNAENSQKTKTSAPNAEDKQTDSLTVTNTKSRKNQKKQ